MDEVTVVVEGDLGTLSNLQLTTLLQKLELFLHTAERVVTIHLISLSGQPHSGKLISLNSFWELTAEETKEYQYKNLRL